MPDRRSGPTNSLPSSWKATVMTVPAGPGPSSVKRVVAVIREFGKMET
jgi:hypothetical protein